MAADRYTPTTNDKGRPAMIVTTTGGHVVYCNSRWDVEAFLGRLPNGPARFPELLEVWDDHAGVERPASGGTVDQALALVASFGEGGAA